MKNYYFDEFNIMIFRKIRLGKLRLDKNCHSSFKKLRHVYWPAIGNLVYELAHHSTFVLYNVIF